MTRLGVHTELSLNTAGTSGEYSGWTHNIDERWNAVSRLIVCLHGHGTSTNLGSAQFTQNTSSGKATTALARTGRYLILSIEANGPASWSKPSVMTAITNAVTAGRNRGAKLSKYGLLGWSMGGLEVFNQIKRDSANIAAAWVWAPALDMDYNYSTAGHTPIANNATWTTEINSAFGGSTAAQFAGYNPAADYLAYRGLGVKVKIAHATNDAVIPQSVSTSFVANVADADISMRTPDIVGDHTGLFQYIPDKEVIDFFDAAVWS